METEEGHESPHLPVTTDDFDEENRENEQGVSDRPESPHLPPTEKDDGEVLETEETLSTKGLAEEAIFDSLFEGNDDDEESDDGLGDVGKLQKQMANKKRKEREQQLNAPSDEKPKKKQRKQDDDSDGEFVNENEGINETEERAENPDEQIDYENSIEMMDREAEINREFEEEVLSQTKTRRRRTQSQISVDQGIIQDFVDRMMDAYNEDRKAKEKNDPALDKLKMLPEVLQLLQKQNIREGFLEGGLLKACRRWLQPFTDGSLPNLKIREGILKCLSKIELNEEKLIKSGIGKSVMALSKHKKETPENRRLCRALIFKWSRPIFAISTSFTELEHEEVKKQEQKKKKPGLRRSSTGSLPPQNFDTALEEVSVSSYPQYRNHNPLWRNRPDKAKMDYVKRPVSEWTEKKRSAKQVESPKTTRLNEKLKSMKIPRNRSSRALSISISRISK